jgi:hypothetical protein
MGVRVEVHIRRGEKKLWANNGEQTCPKNGFRASETFPIVRLMNAEGT